MRRERRGCESEPNFPLTDTPCSLDGGQQSEGWMMGEENNIGKQLLTSFGLFFAGATPVKPDRNGGKRKKGEGYQCSFSTSSMFR